MFGVACFYFLMMVLVFGVSSSKDCRAKIQNGYAQYCYAKHRNIETVFLLLFCTYIYIYVFLGRNSFKIFYDDEDFIKVLRFY